MFKTTLKVKTELEPKKFPKVCPDLVKQLQIVEEGDQRFIKLERLLEKYGAKRYEEIQQSSGSHDL